MGVLSLFDPFYIDTPLQGPPVPGNIFWVPVAYIDEVPRVLDVQRADPNNHTSIQFAIQQVQSHHFTERPNRLPLKLLTLHATEELIVAKGKRRPVLVLSANKVASIAGVSKHEDRFIKPLEKSCHIVAPMFSTSTLLVNTTFFPKFVARIRALKHPQFACLPRLGRNDSEPGEIVRLDHPAVTYLGRGCEYSGFSLHPEVFQLIRDQALFVLSGAKSDYLSTVMEAVKDSLPEDLR
jgi:hypothetical protein